MNKKTLALILAGAGLTVVLFAPVWAVTTSNTTTSAQDLIQQLKQQIENFQAQIEALKAQLAKTKEASQEVKITVKLLRQLKEGMTGDDVKTLQEILATDPDIYPEGKITGFFGALTSRAVKKFQEKFCLDKAGNVGPKTLSKINELLQEGAGSSGKVPPGLLTAPGIIKKFCLTTTTPDRIAPVISEVFATGTTASSTVIKWTTNEKATSKVWYGTVSPITITTSTLYVYSGEKVLNHSLTISVLTASTSYYYIVSSADAAGNTTSSAEKSFITLP